MQDGSFRTFCRSSSASQSLDSLREDAEIAAENSMRLASSSGSVLERSDEEASGTRCDRPKTHKKEYDRKNSDVHLADLPEWLEEGQNTQCGGHNGRT